MSTENSIDRKKTQAEVFFETVGMSLTDIKNLVNDEVPMARAKELAIELQKYFEARQPELTNAEVVAGTTLFLAVSVADMFNMVEELLYPSAEKTPSEETPAAPPAETQQ
jgi:hypothetical protein